MILLVFSLQNTHFLGIYRDFKLVFELQNSSKSIDALCEMYIQVKDFLKKHDSKITKVCYGRGPGSLSAQKLVHIFATTIATLNNAKIYAVNNFALNKEAPIHAFGNSYFVKNENKISLQKFPNFVSEGLKMQARSNEAAQICFQKISNRIELPSFLDLAIFNEECSPLYILDAL